MFELGIALGRGVVSFSFERTVTMSKCIETKENSQRHNMKVYFLIGYDFSEGTFFQLRA